MTTQGALTQTHTGDYSHLEPLPDPPREPDMQQTEGIVAFHLALRLYFARRDDVLISGEGFLRHEATNNAERLAPDCVVAFGVNPEGIVARNGYVISEIGKPPDFVLEVASRSTGRRDYTVKREGYAGYGVTEYWRFDHTGGRYHDAPLAGDRLVGDEYEPVVIHEEAEGLLWGHSAVLGLDLCWDDGQLRFRDPTTGEFLPTPEELHAEAEAERVGRREAEAIAESERAARQSAESRLAEMEAELRRLRGE